jgi:hypothetical protein
MKWIKDVILDLIVTIAIIIAVSLKLQWLFYLIIAYTVLMLLAKAMVLLGDSFLQLMKKTSTDAPIWFSNLLYAINVITLIIGEFYYTAAAWLIIWILSFITHLKTHKKEKAKTK